MKNIIWVFLFIIVVVLLILPTYGCKSKLSFADMLDGYIITITNNTNNNYLYEVAGGIDTDGYIPYYWTVHIRVFSGNNTITLTQREDPTVVIIIEEYIEDDNFIYIIE